MSDWEKFAAGIGTTVFFIGSIIFIAPLATAMGALGGWIVGWFFGNAILSVLGQIGVHDVAMWQLGAAFAFFGSFLRTQTTVKVDK